MTDINLQNGCELWATFDTEDVDASRGIVRDRSGKGRTLEASGGPTYGQPSPVGKAVSFDGTDDYFDFGVVDPTGSAHTVHILAKQTVDSATDTVSGDGFSAIFSVRRQTGRRWWDDTNKGFSATSAPQDEWAHTTFRTPDGQDKHIFGDDGTLLAKENNSSDIIGGMNRVGHGPDDYWEGDIAFVGIWSRALSDAEIDQLSRMTDRMVSRL